MNVDCFISGQVGALQKTDFFTAVRTDGMNIIDKVFSACFGFWLYISVLNSSFLGKYLNYNIASVSCLCMLAIAFVLVRPPARLKAWPLIAGILVLTVSLASTSITLAYTAGFLFFAIGQKANDIAAAGLLALIAGLFTVIICAYMGFIPNMISVDGRDRSYLGFLYPLYASQFALSVSCLVVFIKKERTSIPQLILLFVMNYFVYVETDSRLCFGLSALVLIMPLFLRILPKKGIANTSHFFAGVSFAVCCAVSVLVAALYSPSIDFLLLLNELLNERISLAQSALNDYGIPLFGQHIEFVGNGIRFDGTSMQGEYNYVDCLYVRMLVQYGVLFTCLFLCIMTVSLRNAHSINDRCYVALMLIVAVHCVFDDLSIVLYFNPLLAIACSMASSDSVLSTSDYGLFHPRSPKYRVSTSSNGTDNNELTRTRMSARVAIRFHSFRIGNCNRQTANGTQEVRLVTNSSLRNISARYRKRR